MNITDLLTKFKEDVSGITTPDLYLLRFRELITSLYDDEIEFEDMTEGEVREFVRQLPVMYHSNVPLVMSKEDKNGNTITFKNPKPLFTPNQLSKSGYDAAELTKMLLTKREAQTTVNIHCKNNIGEFIEVLKKTFWNIKPSDVSEFVIGMMEQVYNTQLAAGITNGDPIQSILYIQSPIEGTGKSYATAKVCEMAKKVGLKASVGTYPDKKYPCAREFASNHFTYIDETVSSAYKNVDQEQWMAIVRRFYYTLKEKFEKAYTVKARGGIICLGNCAPVYGTGKVVYTMDNDIRNNRILRHHLLDIVSSHCCIDESNNLFDILKLDTKKYELYATTIRKNSKIYNSNDKKENIFTISIVKILRNIVAEGVLDEILEPAYENNNVYDVNGKRSGIIPAKFNSISANQLMKEAGLSKTDYGYTNLRSKVINALRALQSEGFITKVEDQRNGVEYVKYDITPLVDIDWSIVFPETVYDTPEKEVLATIEEYDRIKDLLVGSIPPSDDTPKDEHTEEDNKDDIWGELDSLEEVEDMLPTEEIPDVPEDSIALIDIPESNASYSDQYQTEPTNKETDQFEVLNPIAGRRCDENVITRRNFIFEMDETPLAEQKEYVKRLSEQGIINRWVYSGSKSIHMRITVAQYITNKEEYKFIWKQLNAKYFDNKADRACSNPARLTRKLNGIRQGTNKKQIGMCIDNKPIDVKAELAAYQIEKRHRDYMKQLLALMDNRKPRKYNTLEETVEHWRECEYKNRLMEAIVDCKNNNGQYEQGILILQSAKFAGFTYEEVSSEFNWGSWNFTERFYDSIEV